MTPAAFKTNWAKFYGKESAAYADHFNDLCRMLGVPTPIEPDPTGIAECSRPQPASRQGPGHLTAAARCRGLPTASRRV